VQDIGGLTFEEGNVTLSPGTTGDGLRMTANSLAYVNTGLTATISTPISQDVPGRALTKIGAGTLVLPVANSYTGATTVSAGTLRLTDTNAIASSSALTLGNGSTLQLRSNSNATFNTPGNGSTSFTSVTHPGTVTVDVGSNGSGSGNTLTLSGGIGINALSGGTSTINFTSSDGYVLRTPVTVTRPNNATSTLVLNPTSASVIVTKLTHGFFAGGNLAITLGGTTTGNEVAAAPDTNWLYITKSGTSTWTWSADVPVAQSLGSVVVSGGNLIVTGTLRAQGDQTRSVQVTSGGTLHYNNPGAVDTSTATNVYLVLNAGTLDQTSGAPITTSTYNPRQYWSGNVNFAGSNGANSDLNLGTGAVTMNATRQVTVQNAATTLTVGGAIGQSAAGYGLTKAGDGTLALSGANAYTGPTTINKGTLLVNSPGSLNAASLVNVNSTGTLGGTGTINGAVTVNTGGTLAPGASAGKLTVNNSLAMGSGSTYIWQLGSGGLADLVDVNGTLSTASSWTLKLMSDGGTPGAGEYNLFTYDAFSGSFTLPTIDPTGTWKTAKVAQDIVGKRIYLSFALPGDTNSDFVVDAADYITLKKNFGSTTAADALSGNFTTPDTTVDWADLNILTTNFGAGSGGASAMTPEPATLGLLMVGALAVIRRRRK